MHDTSGGVYRSGSLSEYLESGDIIGQLYSSVSVLFIDGPCAAGCEGDPREAAEESGARSR